MAIEVVGAKQSDVRRYREILEARGNYTKRFNDIMKSGDPTFDPKPEGYRLLGGKFQQVPPRFITKDAGETKQFDPSMDRLEIAGIANANIIDRMDERLDPKGVDTTNFNKNRVLLSDHMYFNKSVIGRVTSVVPEHDGVHFDAFVGDPSKGALTDTQKDIRNLILQGLIQTVSVGFIPHKIQAPSFDDEGKLLDPAVILIWELLELSVVAVPANAGSTFEMRQIAETARKYFSFNDTRQHDLTGNTKGNDNETSSKSSDIIQSLVFEKTLFTVEGAKRWAKAKDYDDSKVTQDDDSIRLHQRELAEFEEKSLRTVEVEDGVKAINGLLKGEDAMNEKQAQEMIETMKTVNEGIVNLGLDLKKSVEMNETILGHVSSSVRMPCDDDEDKDKMDDEEKGKMEEEEEEEDKMDDEDKKKLKALDDRMTAIEEGQKKIGVIVEKLFEKVTTDS